jgi:hypothetical protein
VLAALITFAAEEGAEPSKTAFYVAGGLLVLFALIVSALGLSRLETFPSSKGQLRGVIALGGVLVAAAMAAAVITG